MKKKQPPKINVSIELKAVLDQIKVHPRETYEDVLRRLIRTRP